MEQCMDFKILGLGKRGKGREREGQGVRRSEREWEEGGS